MSDLYVSRNMVPCQLVSQIVGFPKAVSSKLKKLCKRRKEAQSEAYKCEDAVTKACDHPQDELVFLHYPESNTLGNYSGSTYQAKCGVCHKVVAQYETSASGRRRV